MMGVHKKCFDCEACNWRYDVGFLDDLPKDMDLRIRPSMGFNGWKYEDSTTT